MKHLLKSIFLKNKCLNKNIKGQNNTIDNHGHLENVLIEMNGSNNNIIFDNGCHITNVVINIQGSGHTLHFDEHSVMKQGSFWFEDANNYVVIGKRTIIIGATFRPVEIGNKIIIGEDCLFSWGIDLMVSDFHSITDLTTGRRINPPKDIIINNHVWLGANVHILKGVTIGKNSIIGESSLVTKDIAENSIAVGHPANVIKNNVTWHFERL